MSSFNEASVEAGIRYRVIVVAALAAIVVGAVWYSPFLFGTEWMKLRGINPAGVADVKNPAVEGLSELARSLVVAYVLARFLVRLRVADWKGALLLGAWVWLGFHATLLLFSVIHENMPWKLYAIHAGHGLANELVIAAILGAWGIGRRAPGTSPKVEINYQAVVVAALAALVVGALWYSPFLFGTEWMKLRGINPGAVADVKVSTWEALGEFVRSLVIAYVLARFVALLRVADWNGALLLGVWVWLGFNATLLLGAVIHENMGWKLYAIQAGQGLVSVLVMAAILAAWRIRGTVPGALTMRPTST
jgi:hypothetical protein